MAFSEAYAPNTTDFSAIIDKVIASKATVLLGGGHYADGSTLARQLYGHKVPLKMITLLVAPDSPQWAELGDAAVGVMVPSQWEPQIGLQGAIWTERRRFRQSLHREIQHSAQLRIGGRLRLGSDSATRHRTGGQHRHGQSGGGAECHRHHDVLWPHQVCDCRPIEHGLQVGHAMVLAQWQKDKSGKPVKQVVWPLAGKSANLVYPIH